MKSKYKSLPFRNNVSLIVFKKNKFLLVNLVGWKENWWKFPQGGINESEELVVAGRREFREEIGTSRIKIAGVSKYTNKYDWPNMVIEKKGLQFRGQFQRFLVVEFLGTDANIKTDTKEIRQYRWVSRKEIIQFSKDDQHMVFKNYNGVIPKILKEFSI